MFEDSDSPTGNDETDKTPSTRDPAGELDTQKLQGVVADGLPKVFRPPLLDRYQFDEPAKLLGRGGMGIVWEAFDVRMGRRVAVKVLPDDCFASGQLRLRFQNEAKLASQLEHSRIVRVYDIGDYNGIDYYIMQLIPGARHLDAWVRADHSPRNRIVELMVQVCEAVGAAHAQGIVHLDLKPSNILVDRNGDPYVSDFGLARSMSAVGVGLRGAGGTLLYMPPEQRKNQDPDSRADVYALGRILYQILTGRSPDYLDESPSPKAFSGIEESLKVIIQLATAILCKDRYRDANSIAAELKKYLAGALKHRHAKAQYPDDRISRIDSGAAPAVAAEQVSDDELESGGGAVPLNSKWYVERSTDIEFLKDIHPRRNPTVLVKGARQMGKTSLLARGLDHARKVGWYAALTDFQKFIPEQLLTLEGFYLALCDLLAADLKLEVDPRDKWAQSKAPNFNFERFVTCEVLGQIKTRLVWGLDEVDRLFTCPFGTTVFALLRTWHNAGRGNPESPWAKVTLAIAYATEAHLFIADVNQSPFNVGTTAILQDFTLEQMADLNRRHGSPLRSNAEVARLHRLIGGQPFLARSSYYEMAAHKVTLAQLEAAAIHHDGPMTSHLKRLIHMLSKNSKLMEATLDVLQGKECPDADSFLRLQSAGVLKGTSVHDAQPRCRLYAEYLRKKLL